MATAGLQLRPVGGILHTRSAPQLTSAHPAARHATALLARSSPQTQLLKQKLHLVLSWPASATRSRLSARCEANNGAPSPPWKQKNARLVLEDGSVWHGVAFGATGQAVGEVVFNTSMSGYQVRACQKVAHAALIASSVITLQQDRACRNPATALSHLCCYIKILIGYKPIGDHAAAVPTDCLGLQSGNACYCQCQQLQRLAARPNLTKHVVSAWESSSCTCNSCVPAGLTSRQLRRYSTGPC